MTMAKLNTKPNIAAPDDFYADLLAVHEGLTKAESDALNARLVLILANHVGDRETLAEALESRQGAKIEEERP
jgi:hypothetical protein